MTKPTLRLTDEAKLRLAIDQRDEAYRQVESLMRVPSKSSLKALGRMLEDHYGRSNGDYLLNFATLWDTLLDGLQQGTIDLTDIDKYTEGEQDASNEGTSADS